MWSRLSKDIVKYLSLKVFKSKREKKLAGLHGLGLIKPILERVGGLNDQDLFQP